MRAFLSKLFLGVFIVLFALPLGALAQTGNWTPPSGPPLGNNTPSPVNVGPMSQTKEGPFTSNTQTTLNGFTRIDVSPNQPNNPSYNQFFNFLRTYFLNDFTVGHPNLIGPNVSIIGQLKYKPANSSGVVDTNQLAPGKVLTAVDSDGTIAWAPGLPNGGNNGDTLIWDETCNCWTVGPVTTTNGANLPPGTLGQTLWYSAPNVLEATSQLTHGIDSDGTTSFTRIPNRNIYIGSAGLGRTDIISPITNISGTNSVNVGIATTGQTNINSPQVTFVEPAGNNFSQRVDVKSKYVNFTAPPSGADSQVVNFSSKDVNFDDGAGQIANFQTVNVKSGNTNFVGPTISFQDGSGQPSDYQTVNVKSGNVNFAGPDDGGYQTVTFESDRIKFKNINTNPGAGRIPYALDDEGTFGWNENLDYQINSGGSFPVPLGQLTLRNPNGGTALFQNQGISHLLDNVYIEDTGDLYLYGIEPAAPSERGAGLVKPLCYVTTTKKVVTCYDEPITEAPTDYNFEPVYDTDYEIVRTVADNSGPTSEYIFQSNQTVDIKICGGGGGGGGGGAGVPGNGGGGGGGGAAGDCQVLNNFPVSAGDKLTWNIGDGGNGGTGTKKQTNSSSDYEILGSAGNAGAPTSLFIDYAGDSLGNPVPVGQTQNGGAGGQRGIGHLLATPTGPNVSVVTGGFIGGDGADSALPSWHDGAPGCSGLSVSNCVLEQQNNGPTGGTGGDGENNVGDLAPSSSASSGGNRGTGYISGNCVSGEMCFQIGANGLAADIGNGGGGGGGGAGIAPVTLNGGVVRWPGGGNGGKGGSGYIKVSGILNSQFANSMVFDSPSSQDITFPVSGIPAAVQNITIEVWGGGGGGGGVKTGILADRLGGGGGGGGYIKIPNVPRSQLGANLLIKVGAGGVAGNSSGTASEVTNGGAGGTSYVKVSGSTIPLVSASGGAGGQKDNDNTSGGGAGGTGGQPSTTGSPIAGLPNQSAMGSNGVNDQGGNNSLGGNQNAGGRGADANLTGGLSTSSTSGQSGRVKLSW